MSRAPAIGIDFGTSYSCVGVFNNGKLYIIPNDMGERKIPSWVSFTNKRRFFENEAKNNFNQNEENTVFNIKRLIGHKFDDKEIQNESKLWPFKIVKESNTTRPQVEVKYKNEIKRFYSEEISSMILKKIKKNASKFIGKEVKDAVIAVPNYFNDLQRQAIKDAGTIAGLNIIRVISESSAACIDFAFNRKLKNKEENYVIFGLGGGCLNISVFTVEDGLFEAKSHNGDIHLGGEDFDNRLIEYCINEFKTKTSIDVSQNPKALCKLRIACEKAKRTLSSSLQAVINIEELQDGEDFNIVITRPKFEELCMDLFKKCLAPIENALKDAKMSKSQIDEIILFGGSTRIPYIQSMIKKFFNGKELNKEKNPYEAVAYGTAIQAAIMTNIRDESIERLILLDVSPLSFGIETPGGVMTIMIPRNSTLPCRKTLLFSTYMDNQTTFSVQIYEGERKLTNSGLVLEGIPPMPKGKPVIEVTFDIDANSIINVVVVEKSTGISNKLTVKKNKFNLSHYDIDRMIEEEQKFEEEENFILKGLENEKILTACRNIIQTKVEEILRWSNNNPRATKGEFESKIREFNTILNPK